MRPFIGALLLGALACAPGGRHPAPAPSQPSRAAALAADSARLASELATGARVVRTVCVACHTEQGPPTKAPPFAMVAMHYRRTSASDGEAVARIVRWVRAPDADSSRLPPMMIRRFGLMPPLPLPDSLLGPAARYVISLGHQGMMGRGGMRGTCPAGCRP